MKFQPEAKIVKVKENPYHPKSARASLFNLAVKSKTVAAYLKSAGEPSGGSARSYLGLFINEGVIKLAKSASAGKE